jgi:hypothetical protein
MLLPQCETKFHIHIREQAKLEVTLALTFRNFTLCLLA